uniref:Genome polyprotein n=1 Tax=Lothians earthworm picorna-like virus 1 TaxID=2021954 RepID=A0A221LFL2_9VIRU|nr:putative polyprotein [Lothians earthworm picorna-like virus 1]
MNSTHLHAPEFCTTNFSLVGGRSLHVDISRSRKVVIRAMPYDVIYAHPVTVNIFDNLNMHCIFTFENVHHLYISRNVMPCAFSYDIRVTRPYVRSLSVSCPNLRSDAIVQTTDQPRTPFLISLLRRCVGVNQSKEMSIVDQGEKPQEIDSQVVRNPAFVAPLLVEEPDMKRLFARDYFYQNYEVNMATPANNLLFSISLPCDLLRKKYPFFGVLATHAIVRTDLRVTVKFNVSPFHAGMIMMACYPANNVYATCPQDVMLLPHNIINLGHENSGTLLVEHITPFKFMQVLNPTEALMNQVLSIYVWNKLVSSADYPQIINCSVYFKFENTMVTMKRPYRAVEQMAWIYNQPIQIANELSDDITASLAQETTWGKIGSFGSTLLRYFTSVGSYTAKLLSLGLFDSPSEYVNTMSEATVVDVPKKCISFRVCSGDVMLNKKYRPIDMSHYVRVPGRVGVAHWSVGFPTGKTMMALPLSLVMFEINALGYYSVPVVELARHYEYWRGDLIYTFEVVATKFHQGQVLIGWSPFSKPTHDTNDELRQVYNKSFDIGKENTFSIECPFISFQEWKRTNEISQGALILNVQNPLVAPSAVAPNIEINVYLSAGSNFWFACPRNVRYATAQSLWRPLKEITTPPTYLKDHTHFNVLLKRPHMMYNSSVVLKKDTWCLAALLPTTDIPSIPVGCYLHRGSGRWSFTTTMSKTQEVVFMARCCYAGERQNITFPNLDHSSSSFALRGGSVLLNPNSDSMFRIEIPHMSMLEYLPHRGLTEFSPEASNHQAVVELYAYSASATNFDIFLRWEGGDDFAIFHPLPNPARSIGRNLIIPYMTGNSTPKPFVCSDNMATTLAWKLWAEGPTDIADPQSHIWNDGVSNAWNQVIFNDNFFVTGYLFRTRLENTAMTLRLFYKNHYNWDSWVPLSTQSPDDRGHFQLNMNDPVLARAIKVEVQGPKDADKRLITGAVYGYPLEGSLTVSSVLRFRRAVYQMKVAQAREQSLFGAFSAIKAIGGLWDSISGVCAKLKDDTWFNDMMQLFLIHIMGIANSLQCLMLGGTPWACIATITACIYFLCRRFLGVATPPEVPQSKFYIFKKWLGLEQGGYLTEIVKLLGTVTFMIGSVFKFSLPSEYYEYVALSAEGNDNVLHRFVCFIKYFFYGKSLLEELRQKQIDRTLIFLEDFRFFERNGCVTPAAMRGNGMKMYHDLRERATELESLSMKFKFPVPLMREIRENITTLDAIIKNSLEKKSQPEPVGIFFYAKPGVGKSFLCSHFLAHHVLTELGYKPGDNTDEFVYNMPVTKQRFMDGYNQQPWVAVDEFLQSVDCEDALQVINLISTSCNPVNMAELKEKKMLFKSPIVCCCSNAATFHSVKGIHDVEALVRRFPLTYEITLHNDWMTNGKLNAKKLIDALIGKKGREVLDVLDTVFIFKPREMVMGSRHTNHSSANKVYSELVKEISDLVSSREKVFREMKGVEQISAQFLTMEDYYDINELRTMMTEMRDEYPKMMDILGENFDYFKALELHLPTLPHRVFMRYAKRSAKLDRIDSGEHILTMRLTKFHDVHEIRPGEEECLREDINRYVFKWITIPEILVFNKEKPSWLPQSWYDFMIREPWEGLKIGFFSRMMGYADDHPMVTALAAFLATFTITMSAIIGYYVWKGGPIIEKDEKIANGEPFTTVVKKTVHYEPQAYNGRAKITRLPKIFGQSQDAWLNNQKEVDQIEKIRRNIVRVMAVAVKPDGEFEPYAIEMHALFLNSRTLIMNEHFYREYRRMSSVNKVVIVTSYDSDGHTVLERRIPVDELTSHSVSAGGQDVDMRVVNVPDFPGMKDLSHFIAPDHFCEDGASATLLPGHNGQPCVSGIVGDYSMCETSNGQWYSLDLHPKDGITVAGDCGRPWVVVRKSEVRILGIHASLCDDSILGIATIRLCDMKLSGHIESAVQLRSGKCQLFNEKCVNSVAHTTDFVQTGYVFGDIEWVPSAKGYAALQLNSAKYHERGWIDPETIVTRAVVSYWKSLVKVPQLRTFDFAKALNGTSIMRSIVLSTSCGYLKFAGYHEGKNDLLERVDNELIFTEKARTYVSPMLGKTFVDHLDECDKQIRKRVAFPMLWVSALKDELVSPEKRSIMKTRVIEQPGLDYLILVRKYFGDFLDWYKSHAGTIFKHAIGIDKEVAWKDIALELLRFSPVGLAFDYSQWDGSVPPWCFDIFSQFTDEFYVYNTEDCNARATLLYMLRCSNLLVADEVRLTDRGNKSGNPFTDVFNSICNASVLMVGYAYLQSWNGRAINLNTFDRDMRIVTYGDDVICAVKSNQLTTLNGPAFAHILGAFGFTLTDSLKSERGLASYVDILSPEFTFLKTPFVYDKCDRVWLAPLPMKVIMRELMWIPRKMFGNQVDKEQRVYNVARFLAHYPLDEYQRMTDEMRKQGLDVPYDWRQLRDELVWKQATYCRGSFA